MDEREFTSERTGKLIWEPHGAYYRFEPKELPFVFDKNTAIETQAHKTIFALGKIDNAISQFSDEEINILQTPFILKEAALSSEIEGTHSTITDIYREEKIVEKDIEKRLDNEEVRNYRDALSHALESSEEINEEFIKKIHKKLLRGVRGADKNAGEYKTAQNGIGKRRDTIHNAKFVPASPSLTPTLMKNLVSYMNNKDISPIYRIPLVHYQFETIHPFNDGNGRIGRLLIMLQLCREGLLSQPILYLSEYFAENRDTYIDLLYNVSAKGDIENLILFILKAIEVQANKALELLERIESYKLKTQEEMKKISKSAFADELVKHLVKHPFFTVKDVMDLLHVSQPAAWGLVHKLLECGIAEEFRREGRRKVYFMQGWLDIIDET